MPRFEILTKESLQEIIQQQSARRPGRPPIHHHEKPIHYVRSPISTFSRELKPVNNLLNPDTMDFWREIKSDLEHLEERMPVQRFLQYYHPDRNKGGITFGSGKYEIHWRSFRKTHEDTEQTLDNYLIHGFTP